MKFFIREYNEKLTKLDSIHYPQRSPRNKAIILKPNQRWTLRTGLGVDWSRTITIFLESGLDPDCKSLQKFRIRSRPV